VRQGCAAAALSATLALSAPSLDAQPYPSKPIRIVVGFAAGGPTDVGARTIGQKLTESWGQPVIVDIRAGASGNIAAEFVAKSPPDGYTLLLTVFAHGVNPSLHPKLPYDAIKDFAPIIHYATIANLLVVHPSIPARTVKELIAVARSRPGELTSGSAGVGTSSHLSLVLLNSFAGTKIVHVPYKGLSAAHVDVVGGQISMVFDNVVGAIPQARAGRIRMLAVTTLNRWPGAAEVPTMAEAGLPGYEVNSWYGVLAPASTPRDIVSRLNAEIGRSLKAPDARARLFSIGAEPLSQSPEEFGAFIVAEVAKWAKVVKAAGIKIE
jgi:tripartite-type tricarboxylate transporter receptor subunit TctC